MDRPYSILFLSGAASDYLSNRVAHEALFHQEIEKSLSALMLYPKAGKAFHSFRKINVEKSPFAIFYYVEGRRIMVAAILDMRQDPQAIKRLLADR